jgi:hypothetical protein
MERKPTPEAETVTEKQYPIIDSGPCASSSHSPKRASQRVYMVHACQLLASRFKKDASCIAYARFVEDEFVPSAKDHGLIDLL